MQHNKLGRYIKKMGYKDHEIKEKLSVKELPQLRQNILDIRQEIFLVNTLQPGDAETFSINDIKAYLSDILNLNDWQLANILTTQGLVCEAFPYYKKHIENLSEDRDKEADLLQCLYLYLDLHKEKIRFLDQLLDIYHKDTKESEEAKSLYFGILHQASYSYEMLGEFEKALDYLIDCLTEIDLFWDESYQEDQQIAILSSIIDISIHIFGDMENTPSFIVDLTNRAQKEQHKALAMYRKGTHLLGSQKSPSGPGFHQALELLRKSTKREHPKIIESYFDLARAFHEKYQHIDQTIDILNKSIGLRHSPSQAVYQYFYRGCYLMDAGKIPLAYQCFQKAEQQLTQVNDSYEPILLHEGTIKKLYQYFFYCSIHQGKDLATYLETT